MSILRSPGVYFETKDRKAAPIQLGRSGIAGFIGLTKMGPLNTPVHITSYDTFVEVFGSLRVGSHLDRSVKGYFDNGGRECYIVRIAHIRDRGRKEVAKKANLRVRDAVGEPTLVMKAKNEGEWGNTITVDVDIPAKAKVTTLLTLDLHAGQNVATIKSTHGFKIGSCIKIFDGEKDEYKTIIDIQGKEIFWSAEDPIRQDFKSYAPTYIEPVEFEIKVLTLYHREHFTELSMSPLSESYFVRVVNKQSQLIEVEDLKSPSPLPDSIPQDIEATKLSGGSDGVRTVTPEDFIGLNVGPGERYGLAAFEAITDVDILACPDLMWCLDNSVGFRTLKDVEIVQHAMVTQCEKYKERFAILDVPPGKGHISALQWRLLFDTAYAAFYFPWVVIEEDGDRLAVPPSGFIAGVYSRCDRRFGVHKPPANESIEGVVDVETVLQDHDIAYINSEGVNALKSFPSRGIRVWGARTVSSDPQQQFINVRRILNTIIRAMSTSLEWVVFEPNDPRLWKTIIRLTNGFLMELWRKGMFKGRNVGEAFYIKCDDETNTAAERKEGRVIIEAGVAPVRPAEFIVFRVSQEIEEEEEPI
ncbi:MAG: phage tail sheath family protein [Myxococcales bacterium]|nr:phage tail sheath family protein [Myxococcales bacterium]